MTRDLPVDPDLFVLEFAVNDVRNKAYGMTYRRTKP
jgi:hypothetical protein